MPLFLTESVGGRQMNTRFARLFGSPESALHAMAWRMGLPRKLYANGGYWVEAKRASAFRGRNGVQPCSMLFSDYYSKGNVSVQSEKEFLRLDQTSQRSVEK